MSWLPPLGIPVLFAVLWLVLPALAVLPQMPELPRASIDTTLPDTTGYVTKTVCASGCDFTALHAAVNHPSVKDATTGIILSLKAGETFGPTPRTICRSIAIRGSLSNPPRWGVSAARDPRDPGARRAHAPLVAAAGGSVIAAAPGAHHYRFIGLEISPVPGVFLFIWSPSIRSRPGPRPRCRITSSSIAPTSMATP